VPENVVYLCFLPYIINANSEIAKYILAKKITFTYKQNLE